jgi:hypothetical protein
MEIKNFNIPALVNVKNWQGDHHPLLENAESVNIASVITNLTAISAVVLVRLFLSASSSFLLPKLSSRFPAL